MERSELESLKQKVGLRPYQERLKLERVGSEYKARCPWHPDSNPSLTFFEEGGQWFFKCFGPSCGKSGDVIEFVKLNDKVGFLEAAKSLADHYDLELSDLPGKVHQIDFNREAAIAALATNKPGQQYLLTRGISLEAATKNGIGVWNFPGVGECISIPYATGDVKFRTLNPEKKENKFRSIGKPNHQLYGVETLDDIFLETKLLIVESELDCLTAREHLSDDYAVVSMPSATGSMSKGEFITDEAHLKAVREFDGHIYICTDQDKAGDACASVWLKQLPPYKVSRVTWQGAKDIGELFTKFHDGFATEVERLCEESLVPLLWRKAPTMKCLPEKKMEWVVPQLIPADNATLLTGDFGTCKSYLSLFLADAIGGGGKFAARQCQQHPVLILDRENAHSTLYRRRTLVGDLKRRENVRVLGLFTDPPCPEITSPDLLQICAKVKPFIIVDSLMDFHPGLKESDADDMAAFGLQLRQLVVAGAIGVLCLHHVPKNTTGTGGMYRGSTAIVGSVWGALFVEKRGLKSGPILTIKGFKTRDSEQGSTELKLHFGDDSVTYEVLNVGMDPETELHERIVTYIEEHPECGNKKISEALELRHQTVVDTTRTLESAGRIKRTGDRQGGRGATAGWVRNTNSNLDTLQPAGRVQ